MRLRAGALTLAVVLVVGLLGGFIEISTSADVSRAAVKPVGDAGGKTPKVVPWTNLEYGFQMALLGNNSLVRSMGFTWVAYGVSWETSEPVQGQFNWGDADNIVNYARNSNINVLIRVSRSPGWARDAACSGNPTCPPRDPRLYGDFMLALAAHVADIKGNIRVAYEIWNEPNTDLEWGGLCPDAARYAGIVRATYPRVKASDPDALVVAGAVTTVGQTYRPHCAVDDLVFLRGMYDAGAAAYFDILSTHPYGYVYAPETDPATSGPRLVFRRAERQRELMVQYGDSGKQMWATEMGWALDPALSGYPQCQRPDWLYVHNPQQQADYLVRAYQWARSYWPWMGAMFTFNFDFNEAPWYDTCHAFRFWSVKNRPAQAALSAWAHNPPPTFTPTVDNPPAISAVRYSAVTFNRDGGTLLVEVDASDDDSTPIESVQAVLHLPGGGTQNFTFALVSGTTRNGTWRVGIPIPLNNSGGTQTYTVGPYAVEVQPSGRTTNAPPQQITVTGTRFWDVPDDFWAYSFIEYLAGAGVISGYADGTFRPNNNATRGQFSKMIVLAEGWPIDLTGAPHFTDVPPSGTFYQFVETAVNHGVINGYSDLTFRPLNNITRGQIAKIVTLAEGWTLLNPPVSSFSDVPRGSTFYQFVETAVAHGIVSGYSDGTFRPNTNATRAQLSKMLYLAVTGHTTVTPTPTSTDVPTGTPIPTDTLVPTLVPTNTPVLTDTPTAIATPTYTATPIETSTETPTPTPTSSASPP